MELLVDFLFEFSMEIFGFLLLFILATPVLLIKGLRGPGTFVENLKSACKDFFESLY